MKIRLQVLTSVFLVICVASPVVAETKIKLSGRKDLVLSVDSRATVLEVARQHLSEKEDAYLAQLSEIKNPYAFEQAVQTVLDANTGEVVEAPAEEVVVHYDDASVLQVVAASFAQQVRGTLARGSTSYLQLKGGSMVKPGTSFPATIPQAKGKSFRVTITEITSSGYTLQLGEASQNVSLNVSSSGGGGAIKLN